MIHILKKTKLALGAITLALVGLSAQAADTIKVGVLHSQSGPLAISETTLKNTVLMLIEAQNKKRWCVGQKIGSRCC